MSESSSALQNNALDHTGMSFNHATDRFYPFANNRTKDENFRLSQIPRQKGPSNAGCTHS
ncbi:MAG: hypothetical protein RSE94_16405 [Pseudomonas sp.]